MSKKLKMPKNGLFGLPSSVRQTNNEEISSTQVLENQDTVEPDHLRTEEVSNSNTSTPEDSHTLIHENLEALGSTNQDTELDWQPAPIIAVEDTNTLKNQSTTIPEELDIQSSQVPENSSTKQLNNSDIEVPKNSSIEILKNPNTQVLENTGTQEPENHSTEKLENFDAEVPENHSIKDVKFLDSQVLPKKQKDNRKKDDKKPVRKQASVHLSGSTLKALHLFAYQEGLEKSEVVEKALRKFIPKKFFE